MLSTQTANSPPRSIYLPVLPRSIIKHWVYEQALPWACYHAEPVGCQHTHPHQPDVQSQLLQRPFWAQAGRQPSWQPHSSSSCCQKRVRSSSPWLSAGVPAALIPVSPAQAAAVLTQATSSQHVKASSGDLQQRQSRSSESRRQHAAGSSRQQRQRRRRGTHQRGCIEAQQQQRRRRQGQEQKQKQGQGCASVD